MPEWPGRPVSDNGRWPHLRDIGWHCDWWGGQCWCGGIHTSYAAVKLNGGTDRGARMPR